MGEDDDPSYPLSGGEVPARDCGPLTWSRVGGMNSYNLIVRPNSFIQMWFSKAGSKQVTHVQTDYVDMDGNARRVMGAKTTEEGGPKPRGPGRPPTRRSPRHKVAQASQYVAISPARDLGDLDQLLGVNINLQGIYDISINTT